MDQQYDLDRIGKRMPYKVPEDFFSKLEDNVLEGVAEKEIAEKNTSRKRFRLVTSAIVAVAASVAVFFFINIKSDTNTSTNDSESEIELAFSKLSAEDQAYLLETYQEDVFFSDNIN